MYLSLTSRQSDQANNGKQCNDKLHCMLHLYSSNPLQWSFLENPRDGGAWWAAIYGAA